MDTDRATLALLLAAYGMPALGLLLTGAGLAAALLGALLALPITMPLAGLIGGVILGARR